MKCFQKSQTMNHATCVNELQIHNWLINCSKYNNTERPDDCTLNNNDHVSGENFHVNIQHLATSFHVCQRQQQTSALQAYLREPILTS